MPDAEARAPCGRGRLAGACRVGTAGGYSLDCSDPSGWQSPEHLLPEPLIAGLLDGLQADLAALKGLHGRTVAELSALRPQARLLWRGLATTPLGR